MVMHVVRISRNYSLEDNQMKTPNTVDRIPKQRLFQLLFFVSHVVVSSEPHRQTDRESEILFNPFPRRSQNLNNSEVNAHLMRYTRSKVVEYEFECEKRCNYQPFIDGPCFGSFQMDCEVAQQYQTGQVLQTRTSLSCIGNFNNNTEPIEDFIQILTICDGMFSQVQVINLYDPVYTMGPGHPDVKYIRADTYFTSYSCRYRFTFAKKLELDDEGRPILSAGNEETSCDAAQAVQVQKGYCAANNQKCTSTEKDTPTKFSFRPFNNKVKEQDSLESNLVFDDAGVHPRIDQVSNFQTLAKHDPVLAQKLANSILTTVADKGVASNKRDQALLELLMNPDNGIETAMGFMLAFSSNPSTKWLDILCNGQGTSFSSTCNGLFTAQVGLYQQGSGFMSCEGGWYAYEDITYVCDGSLTEDETLHANNNYRFSKLSQCLGTVAISPLSTEVLQGIKYYGLSEICNGKTVATSSYQMDEVDHRIFARVVNTRASEQIICLMEDKTCEHLS